MRGNAKIRALRRDAIPLDRRPQITESLLELPVSFENNNRVDGVELDVSKQKQEFSYGRGSRFTTST